MCGPRTVPRSLARGVYRLGVQHTAPTTTTLGVGAVHSLGVFDLQGFTSPEEAQTHQDLAPIACHEGCTIVLRSKMDAGHSAVALQLWIATMDRMPMALPLTAVAPFADAWNTAGAVEAFTATRARAAIGDSSDDPITYLATSARNALDVCPYLHAPGGCVVDLAELAGGARYAQVWLRAVNVLNPLHLGNDLQNVNIPVEWEALDGCPARASHAERWLATAALTSLAVSFTPGNLFASLERRRGSLVAPFAGTLHWNVTNGSATHSAYAGVEVRGGPSVSSRDSDTFAAGAPTVNHLDVGNLDNVGGSLGLYVAPNAAAIVPVLMTLEVLR